MNSPEVPYAGAPQTGKPCRLTGSLSLLRRGASVAGGVLAAAGLALLAWLVAQPVDSARLWRAVLVSFLFFTPLAAGLATWPAVTSLSRGTWARDPAPLAAQGMGFAVPSLFALLALALGSRAWAPWWSAPPPQGVWLYPPFVFGRDFAALAGFWLMAAARLRRPASGVRAGLAVLVYALVFSLLGFDLVMALDPHWHSALFGGYFFISGLYAGMAAWALLAVCAPGTEAHVRHDLARLVVAFSLLTTYLMFVQLVTIWYGNLPGETRFVAPRLRGPWAPVSAALLVIVYFGPLVGLLTIRARRSAGVLGAAAMLILCGLWVERWWLVAPTFDTAPRFGLPEIAPLLAFLGVFVLSLAAAPRLTVAALSGASEP